MEEDIASPADRGETLSMMEPTRIGDECRARGELADLALDLAQKSASFRRSLPADLVGGLADLVRSMNCYYSNLIEGHATHPIDIERALAGQYSQDARQRDLQREAQAHIAVQGWIDGGALGRRVFRTDSLCEIHRRFCAELPDDLLRVENAETGERRRVIPGAFRDHDAAVGRHVPVSSGALPRFMARFEQVYGQLGKADGLLALAAAHHRLLWIHPFADGNGRVARLMAHAVMLDATDSGALWSIARGFARSVTDYRRHLADCDQQRRNDLDGRGNLSEEALVAFTRYMLKSALDQVAFMEGLMQPNKLRGRILGWAADLAAQGRLPPRAGNLLEALLHRGRLERAEVAALAGIGDRQGRRLAAALIEIGVVTSPGPRAPLALAFPAALAGRWLPGLFPDQP